MSDNTREMCEQHAQSLRATLEELWAAADAGELVNEDGARYDGDADEMPDGYDREPLEYLDEMPLEVVWEHGTPFAVVFGVGGPHVEILWDTRDGGPRIVVYWAGERAYARGEAVTRTAEYFRELVDQD